MGHKRLEVKIHDVTVVEFRFTTTRQEENNLVKLLQLLPHMPSLKAELISETGDIPVDQTGTSDIPIDQNVKS